MQVSTEQIESDQISMKEGFEDEIIPLVDKYPQQLKKSLVTLELFLLASAWVSSRAFYVDEYHGTISEYREHACELVNVNRGNSLELYMYTDAKEW